MSTSPERKPTAAAARSQTSDAELLRAVAAGSEPAFAELRNRYAVAVRRVCRAVAGAEHEDCEQEVFTRVWRKAALYDPARGSAAAWLLTVARRAASNLRAARRPPVPTWEIADDAQHDLEAFWLQAGMTQLPERERTVIELAYYADLSESAIAQRLRVPLGSVKSWKRRGLNRLASLLEDASL
ncbi:MAG TPA: sigma-70 family RNA polymerase sigma factor [Gaiellaceae bacterium]|nr:sigma-70 family RNA polymerase sigma factor [Gaiellaceae bacterium]